MRISVHNLWVASFLLACPASAGELALKYSQPAARLEQSRREGNLAASPRRDFRRRLCEGRRALQKMQGSYNESYQSLGDLRLNFPDAEDFSSNSYERNLDLDRAVATVRYLNEKQRTEAVADFLWHIQPSKHSQA